MLIDTYMLVSYLCELFGNLLYSFRNIKFYNIIYSIYEIILTKSYLQRSCIIEFDGASRGNPGPAGAGAILRSENGNVVPTLRNNSSELYTIFCLFIKCS